MLKKLLFTGIFATATCFATQLSGQGIAALTTSDQLVIILNPAAPAIVIGPIPVSGISSGQSIEGLDFRPNTGELYALGYNSGTGDAQIYTIDQLTAIASPVNNTPVNLALGTGSIGFDFNPTVDRIRIVGANGKNYRLHPTTGAIVATDGDLNYAGGDPNDGAIPSIGACAYTKSYIASESTTLFGYDEELNIFVTQSPPNNGTLNTVGASGININPADRTIDFDIFYDPISGTDKAYMNANIGNNTNDDLFEINLSTGAVTNLGTIGLGIAIKDIAVRIDRNLPIVSGQVIYGLTKNNGNLISFDTDTTEYIRTIASITGVTTGQALVGMDFRPATKTLYALGYDAGTMEYQLYTINTASGVATAVNANPIAINLGAGIVGFDFNPTVDRIRVVSESGKNYRLNPNDGALVATDTDLMYASGDVNAGQTPAVGAVAYINSFNMSPATTLFGIDDVLATFVSIAPPNDGELNTIATNILNFNPADLSSDLDFFYDSTVFANKGFMAANIASSVNDNLYSITEQGVVTLIGPIGFGVPVRDITAVIEYSGSQGLSTENLTSNAFMIYPNPVLDATTFILPLTPKGEIIIRLTDLSGRIMYNANYAGGNDFIKVSLNGLAQGIYVAEVFENGQLLGASKLVKQ